jgi:aryl-alcohol dehydrogenase-like predicted oxidoreductase
MTFGAETAVEEAHEQLDRYVEAGGTFIDTADVYAGGESERIVGGWLASRRVTDEVIVATKARFRPPPGSHGASRRALQRCVDASLERLGVERLDVFWVHGWDEHTPIGETLDTLSALVRAGKISHLGWSNVTAWQLQRIVTTARLDGHVAPLALQPQWNLLERSVEIEVVPCCLSEGLGIAPWSPLGGGWLTGKYRRDQPPTGATRLGEDPQRGVEAYDVRDTERTWTIVDAVRRVADRRGVPMHHVAIAWLASRPGVSTVLLGARTVTQLEGNLGAATLELDEDDLDELTTASDPYLPEYPYGMIRRTMDVTVWDELGLRLEREYRGLRR